MSKEVAAQIVLMGASPQTCVHCHGEGTWQTTDQPLSFDRNRPRFRVDVQGCAQCVGMGAVHDFRARRAHALLGVPLPPVPLPVTDILSGVMSQILDALPYLRELARAACNPSRPLERASTPRLTLAVTSNGIQSIHIDFIVYAKPEKP